MVKPALFDCGERLPDTSRPGGRSWIFQGSDHLTYQYSEIFSDPDSSTHTHPFEQTILIMGGKANFWCDSVVYEMAEGCFMQIPADIPHGIEQRIGDELLKVLEVFYPKRTEDRTESERVKNLCHLNWD